MLFALLIISSMAVSAQKIASTNADSLNMKPQIELNAGDYLIKASNDLWSSVVCAGLSTVFFSIYADNKNYKSSGGNMAIFPAMGFGMVGLIKVISIPMNLNRAGKAYKREYNKL